MQVSVLCLYGIVLFKEITNLDFMLTNADVEEAGEENLSN